MFREQGRPFAGTGPTNRLNFGPLVGADEISGSVPNFGAVMSRSELKFSDAIRRHEIMFSDGGIVGRNELMLPDGMHGGVLSARVLPAMLTGVGKQGGQHIRPVPLERIGIAPLEPLPRMETNGLSYFSRLPQVPRDPEIISNIDILATFVVRNGIQYEDMARSKHARNPKFDFLFGGELGSEADIGLKYYEWKKQSLEKVYLSSSAAIIKSREQQRLLEKEFFLLKGREIRFPARSPTRSDDDEDDRHSERQYQEDASPSLSPHHRRSPSRDYGELITNGHEHHHKSSWHVLSEEQGSPSFCKQGRCGSRNCANSFQHKNNSANENVDNKKRERSTESATHVHKHRARSQSKRSCGSFDRSWSPQRKHKKSRSVGSSHSPKSRSRTPRRAFGWYERNEAFNDVVGKSYGDPKLESQLRVQKPPYMEPELDAGRCENHKHVPHIANSGRMRSHVLPGRLEYSPGHKYRIHNSVSVCEPSWKPPYEDEEQSIPMEDWPRHQGRRSLGSSMVEQMPEHGNPFPRSDVDGSAISHPPEKDYCVNNSCTMEEGFVEHRQFMYSWREQYDPLADAFEAGSSGEMEKPGMYIGSTNRQEDNSPEIGSHSFTDKGEGTAETHRILHRSAEQHNDAHDLKGKMREKASNFEGCKKEGWVSYLTAFAQELSQGMATHLPYSSARPKLSIMPEFHCPSYADSFFSLLCALHELYKDETVFESTQRLLLDVQDGRKIDPHDLARAYRFRFLLESLRVVLNKSARQVQEPVQSIDFDQLSYKDKCHVLLAKALQQQAMQSRTVVAIIDAASVAGIRKYWNAPVSSEVSALASECFVYGESEEIEAQVDLKKSP